MIFKRFYKIEISDKAHPEYPLNYSTVAARNPWSAKKKARILFEKYHEKYYPDYKLDTLFNYKVVDKWLVNRYFTRNINKEED